MSRDIAPAISREVTRDDAEAEVLATVLDRVTFTRGLGDTGYRLEVVEFECPVCGYDRMLREWRVNPEAVDRVNYFCQKPSCPHFVGEEFSYVRAHRARSTPVNDFEE